MLLQLVVRDCHVVDTCSCEKYPGRWCKQPICIHVSELLCICMYIHMYGLEMPRSLNVFEFQFISLHCLSTEVGDEISYEFTLVFSS